MMRVPMIWVIPLCLVVAFGVWWVGTKDRDFLTPPSEQKLSIMRQQVEKKLQPKEPSDAANPIADTVALTAKQAPLLDDFRSMARDKPDFIVTLARDKERRGERQQALIAWERVIDTLPAESPHTNEALKAVKRLRMKLPPWNQDPTAGIAITLHAGTDKRSAAILSPILTDIAVRMTRASSGILKVESVITAGDDMTEQPVATPTAIWMTGTSPHARSTEILSLTLDESQQAEKEVLLTVFKLIQAYLGRTLSLNMPDARFSENPKDLLDGHVTRHAWRELGLRLNKSLD